MTDPAPVLTDELGQVTLYGALPGDTDQDQVVVSSFRNGLVHLCAFDQAGEGACLVIKADELAEALRLVTKPED